MSKHTKGPWIQNSFDIQDGIRFSEIVLPDNSMRIARVDFNPRTDSEANAKLIAAAPELLEALQQMFEMYHDRAFESEEKEAFVAKVQALLERLGTK